MPEDENISENSSSLAKCPFRILSKRTEHLASEDGLSWTGKIWCIWWRRTLTISIRKVYSMQEKEISYINFFDRNYGVFGWWSTLKLGIRKVS